MEMQFEKVSSPRCRVGESIVWDELTKEVLWADIPAGRIYAFDTSTKHVAEWQLPDPVGSFGLADDGRLVVAMSSGVHLFDRRTGQLEFLVDPEPEQASNRPKNRLNDGKVGPDGMFWVGSMHVDALTARLYRVHGDGRVDRMVEGLGTSNGLAFTADGRTMFHSDSKQCWVDRYDLDPDSDSGTLSQPVRIAQLDETTGRPDGAAVDVEGRYWSAGVSAGVLNCFSRDGRLIQSHPVPCKRPTMPCFGGDDMRTLYLTSIWRPDDATEHCGYVWMTRVDVPGVRVDRFRVSPRTS